MKNNVRIAKRDIGRVDVVVSTDGVRTKVPVPDTDAWAQAQAEEAREALRAELAAARAKAEQELEAELAERRAKAEQEFAAAKSAEPTPADATEADGEVTEKVAEPEVKKVREPSVTKGRTATEK